MATLQNLAAHRDRFVRSLTHGEYAATNDYVILVWYALQKKHQGWLSHMALCGRLSRTARKRQAEVA